MSGIILNFKADFRSILVIGILAVSLSSCEESAGGRCNYKDFKDKFIIVKKDTLRDNYFKFHFESISELGGTLSLENSEISAVNSHWDDEWTIGDRFLIEGSFISEGSCTPLVLDKLILDPEFQ